MSHLNTSCTNSSNLHMKCLAHVSRDNNGAYFKAVTFFYENLGPFITIIFNHLIFFVQLLYTMVEYIFDLV